jgi:proton-translocating NADH-quinone oxidoreductase chain M/proton-translocating NADH-quinone oxidoreductase chain N
MPLLSLIVFLPLVGAVLALLVGDREGRRDALVRWIALATSLVVFALTLLLWARFDAAPAAAEFQFLERVEWIPAFGISYHLGVDGISLLLIVLTGLLTPISLLSSWGSVKKKTKEFSFFMLALETGMLGVFASLDLFLFYIFWDAMLVPMYFLIGVWGYERRIYAAVKFILYTMAGSVLMLIAILGLAYLHSTATGAYSFDLLDLYALDIPRNLGVWFFLLAFAIKVPMWPFHTWLPDAHVEAPTAGSIILAGVLLKLGGYGFLRFSIPLLPDAAVSFGPIIIGLAIIAIVYGGLVAMVQPDMKKLVAYSSVSHMGFVMLGAFVFNEQGLQGAVYQMISHGVTTGALFLLVGVIYEQTHDRQIAHMGGLNARVPRVRGHVRALHLRQHRAPGALRLRRRVPMPIGGLGVIGLLGAAVASIFLWNRDAVGFGVIRADNFSLFFYLMLAAIGILTIMISSQAVEQEELPQGEYYALTLFAIAGMMMIASATDLLVIFLALEILSLAVYVLTGLRRSSMAGAEGAFKYFLLGAFSSAFFLYGIAFTFVVTGSTRLDAVGVELASRAMQPGILPTLAVGLLVVGFAFKVSAVPFHMWTPDAYEGAPTVVTGFMSTAVKAAAFAAFLRVFLSAFEPMRGDWTPILWTIAIATMILGTVVGVAQTNVKRMLAYSSIAHAGYLLVALVAANAANPAGKAAVLFYLAAYAVTNLGAFGVVALLATRDRAHDEIRDFGGLANRRPGIAALMTVFLLSLGGLPPTAGFIGKWYVFYAAVQEGYYGLAIVGVLTSVISVFFYLRIVVMMYMTEGPQAAPTPFVSRMGLAALTVAVIAVFYLGILPTRLLDLALTSVGTIF